jgi:hypothetical protein
MPMIAQVEKKITQPRKARLRWFLVACCTAVLLLVGGCITVWFLILRGDGEPATASVAERVTREFVQTLHNGDIEAAHQLFSEKIRSEISKDDITRVLETDENGTVFRTYESLQVCDWSLFMTDEGRVISAKGLLHYKDGDVVFENDLRKDSDSVWRIYGFWLKSDIDPKPFGRCH